jgi:hypothetical protein
VVAPLRALVLVTALGAGQLLPPPRDGEIRTVYYELQNVTDVWLTLEPRTAKGERAPLVALTYRFPGRRQTTSPREVEVQAFSEQFWAPRPELWFELDGQRIEPPPSVPGPATGLLTGVASDYWSVRLPIDVMHAIASAHRVQGSSLGFPFELSASQLQAIRTWLARIELRR